MENSTHSFRETNFMLQRIQESQIKSKTVVGWSLRKKEGISYAVFFLSEGIFCNICVSSQCIVY